MWYLRNKALVNDASEKYSRGVKLFVWVLVKESVLFKQVPQHALKHFLQHTETQPTVSLVKLAHER